MSLVQICGQAPSIADAPVIDGAERWILGAAFEKQGAGPWTRLFDVHNLHEAPHHPGILNTRPKAWEWYQQQTKPIYLVESHPDVPSSVTYPRQAINERFGVRGGSALSSSIDHMMAVALLEGFTHIRLEGVRMLSMQEWETQRECLAYWIGMAEGMGVDVDTDPRAAFCAPEIVYGFGDPTGAVRAPGQPIIVYGIPGRAA